MCISKVLNCIVNGFLVKVSVVSQFSENNTFLILLCSLK